MGIKNRFAYAIKYNPPSWVHRTAPRFGINTYRRSKHWIQRQRGN